ncbi:hypothetical protein RUM43_014586 [Polyplax serrata]|uniref:Uncharacterized protein n=1 Tax=Polyplax serrata TaxID=468196 RepID=A0AAN8PI96_POLSC
MGCALGGKIATTATALFNQKTRRHLSTGQRKFKPSRRSNGQYVNNVLQKTPGALKLFGLAKRFSFSSSQFPGNFLYSAESLGKEDNKRFRRRRDTAPRMTEEFVKDPTRDRVSEKELKLEIARMNLDVLKRLSGMLEEEREKYSAERQMLGASRDMLRAEMRKAISERRKLDSERRKVDLQRDMLESQVLGRGYLGTRVPRVKKKKKYRKPFI